MALSDTRWNRHHSTAPRAHGEAGVLRENENAAAADAGDAELLHRGHRRAHRAPDGGSTDRVGEGDMALLAGDLPSGLRSVRHLRRNTSTMDSVCVCVCVFVNTASLADRGRLQIYRALPKCLQCWNMDGDRVVCAVKRGRRRWGWEERIWFKRELLLRGGHVRVFLCSDERAKREGGDAKRGAPRGKMLRLSRRVAHGAVFITLEKSAACCRGTMPHLKQHALLRLASHTSVRTLHTSTHTDTWCCRAVSLERRRGSIIFSHTPRLWGFKRMYFQTRVDT